VLAEEALPLVAEPPESADDELLLDGAEVAVLFADVLVIDAVDTAVADPPCVYAARPAKAATATVPATAEPVVRVLRNRRAWSRSATVTRCFRGLPVGSGRVVFTHLRMAGSPVAEVRDSWVNAGSL
jgi:hypothetical protein